MSISCSNNFLFFASLSHLQVMNFTEENVALFIAICGLFSCAAQVCQPFKTPLLFTCLLTDCIFYCFGRLIFLNWLEPSFKCKYNCSLLTLAVVSDERIYCTNHVSNPPFIWMISNNTSDPQIDFSTMAIDEVL